MYSQNIIRMTKLVFIIMLVSVTSSMYAQDTYWIPIDDSRDPMIDWSSSNFLQDISNSLPIIPGSGETNDVPIDGGLGLLLTAGAAYGTRRLRKRKAK